MTDDNTTDLDRALSAARDAMAIAVPDGAAARAAAAALAAPAPPRASWWAAALPIVWRAAAIVDAAALVALIVVAVRGSEPAHPRQPPPDAVDTLLADETTAVLERALRLSPATETSP